MKSFIVLQTLFFLCQWKETTSKSSSKDDGCPKGWVKYRDTDRCFYVSDESDTYEKAKKSCASMKSHLVAPIACDKQIELPEIMEKQRGKCRKGQNCLEFWIGIDNLKGKIWKAPDGYEISKNRKCHNWAKDFPKEKDGNCAIMSFKENKKKGVWKNINCDKKVKYACITCPHNFEHVPEINKCFYVNTHPANWSVAQHACSKFKKGAQLLEIQDLMKQDAVARFLKHVMTRKETGKCLYKEWPHGGKIVWLGGQTTDPKKCRTPYVWKSVGADTKPFNYTNWLPKVPNCGYNIENCAIMTTGPDYNYGWEDLWCDAPLCSVCEF